MIKRLIVPLICVLSLACASAAEDPVSHCDTLIAGDLHDIYASLDEATAKSVRLDLEGSTYTWRGNQDRNRVRKLASASGARDFVRLEVGRSPGTGYNSLWFMAKGSTVEEFATGAEGTDVKQSVLPDHEWRAYKERLSRIARRDLASRVSSAISDSPVYFFCAHLDGQDYSFVLEEFPDRIPQYQLIVETFSLSRFKKVPRELLIFVTPNEAVDHHPD